VEVKNRKVNLILIVMCVMGSIVWVGYSSRKAATRTRTFEHTKARFERGLYIVEGPGHCFQCHSEIDWEKPGAQPKAGKKGAGTDFTKYGLPWLVAPNITPDIESGAGAWTDDQLARAIREGIGHDGRRLFPVMPYRYFRQMSDEDLASVIVYLRSIEPVHNELPVSVVPERLKQALPEHQPIVEPVRQPDLSNPVARGKYLVSLAGCASCHTPTKQGVPTTELAFAGGMSFKGPWGDVNSANLTPDPSGIGYYDEALFITALRTGRVGARKLKPIMPWGYFRNMTDDDLKDIFAYLRSLSPIEHRIDNGEPPTSCPVCGGKHGYGDRNH
jgi:mono/diheme cytochrome c family protein